MNTSKLAAGAAGLIAIGAAGFGAREFRAAREASEAAAAMRRQSSEVRASLASLEKKLLAEAERSAAVEGDNATLARAVQQTQEARAKAVAAASSTREAFEARVKDAVAFAKDGDASTALSELLRCWDAGLARSGGLESVHATLLLGGLIKLAERHPAARVALREKMEIARRRVLGSSDDSEPIGEVGMIARALKDDNVLIALYDQIPEGDRRRTLIAIQAFDQFVGARRYGDALMGRSYGSIASRFEMQIQIAPKNPSLHTYAINSAAKYIEALAGAGDIAHARSLAERLLAYNSAESTRALIQKHAERAGQPGLLTAPTK